MASSSKVPAIGIDLGTTYSCVGVFQHSKVEIIANDQGNRTTPSYIAFTDTERLLGDAAKNRAVISPNRNVIFDAKRLIGRNFTDQCVQDDMKFWPFKVLNVNGKPKVLAEYKGEEKVFAPEELSSMVLTKMKATAEAYLGDTVKDAVITVPAYFNDSQRQATKDAGAIAGLNVLRIVNEPTAAALAYGLDKGLKGRKNVLIYDLGGGTFDVSILSIDEGSIFEVRSTSGDTHLGGQDFDNRLVTHFTQEFERKYNKDISMSPKAKGRLRDACEKAKRILSSSSEASIEIDALFEGIDFYSKITRAKFERLCEDLFNSTMEPVERALRDAKLDKSKIHEIVVVGGSTKIPKLQKLLSDFFGGKRLNKSVNPDEAVAYGAAIQAAILTNDMSDIIKDVLLIDVAPLSLGVEVSGYEMGTVIKRGTTIPAKATQTYTTHSDFQRAATFCVYEGERVLTKDNYYLGTFTLYGIPPLPSGIPQFLVTFDIDANGILTVNAKDKMTGNKCGITIKNDRGRLTQEEIAKMIADAEIFQEDDNEKRECLQARSDLERNIFRIKHSIEIANDSLFSPGEKEKAKSEVQEAQDWLDSNNNADKEEIEDRMNELESYFSPLMTRLEDYQEKNNNESADLSFSGRMYEMCKKWSGLFTEHK